MCGALREGQREARRWCRKLKERQGQNPCVRRALVQVGDMSGRQERGGRREAREMSLET